MTSPDTAAITMQDEVEAVVPLAGHQSSLAVFWYRLRQNKPALLGAIIILVMLFMAIFAPLIAPYDPNAQDLNHLTQPPGGGHILGTDDLGRDVLSRIIFG